jgi:hypothetical protein
VLNRRQMLHADAKLWDAEVGKMIKVFGAPTKEADGKDIVEYLVKNYGKQLRDRRKAT